MYSVIWVTEKICTSFDGDCMKNILFNSINLFNRLPISKGMKSIIIFYEDYSGPYAEKKVFNGLSSLEAADLWAEKLGFPSFVVKCSNMQELFGKINELCLEEKADSVIFSYHDLPFLNLELTRQLLKFHTDYEAEYTYADGYSYGFASEIIDAGTVAILFELSKTKFAEAGQKKVTRTGIFDFIKNDINAFEVETLIAENDWRLFRFSFDCGKKENFLACQRLFDKIQGKALSVNEICKIASETPGILKTLPAFYNIQITDFGGHSCLYCPYAKAYQQKTGLLPNESKNCMNFEKFSDLIDRIYNFSENAVIGLSAWGEASYHPELLRFIEKILSYKGLSVIIESDGSFITDDFCSELGKVVDRAEERTNGWQKIMFVVKMDAFSDATYKKIHGQEASLEKSVEAVKKLAAVIPHCVYPQFIRMNENEEELESFFRYWNEKTNPSQGEFIIQKYDDFAKLLPQCKPADLSPIERNVCWHLRRDMTILTDGIVPFCREYVLDGIIGNVFEESLESIWQKTDSVLNEQMSGIYKNKCKDCDEYYTYNF